MSLEDLFTLARGSLETRLGFEEILRSRMSPGTRHGIAEVLAGRVTIAMGQAVGGSHNFPESAVDLLRRRALADALRDMIGLCALYGVGPEELSAMLGHKEG